MSMVIDELLTVKVINKLLFSKYECSDCILLQMLFGELKQNIIYSNPSNTVKSNICQYFALVKLMKFNKMTIANFIYKIYSDEIFETRKVKK